MKGSSEPCTFDDEEAGGEQGHTELAEKRQSQQETPGRGERTESLSGRQEEADERIEEDDQGT